MKVFMKHWTVWFKFIFIMAKCFPVDVKPNALLTEWGWFLIQCIISLAYSILSKYWKKCVLEVD